MTDFENSIGLSAAELAALNDVDSMDTADQEGRDDDAGYREEISSQTMMALANQVASPDQLELSIQQIRQARDELESAYEEGDSDLTYAEHRAKLREMDRALLDLNGDLAESRMISRMANQAASADWQRQVDATRREARKMGLDLRPGSELEKQWDRIVRFLGSEPENADKPASWFLKTALEMVASRHDKLDPSHYPKGGRVSAPRGLDSLKGLALEQALARMSPEEAERWLTA